MNLQLQSEVYMQSLAQMPWKYWGFSVVLEMVCGDFTDRMIVQSNALGIIIIFFAEFLLGIWPLFLEELNSVQIFLKSCFIHSITNFDVYLGPLS